MGYLLRLINVWTGALAGAFVGFLFCINAHLHAEYDNPYVHQETFLCTETGFMVSVAIGAIVGVLAFHFLGNLLEGPESPIENPPPIAHP